jgi:hypothetical protein
MRNIILLTLLGLCNCTTKKNETGTTRYQEISSTNDDFIELINRFKPEGTAIVGLVRKTEDKAIILVTYPADILIPSLKVYNLKGNLIGDMSFMTDYCGGEPGFYNRLFFKIDKNLSLIQIDTLFETTFDTLTYHTLDTVDIKITTKRFKVNENGEVVEDNAP